MGGGIVFLIGMVVIACQAHPAWVLLLFATLAGIRLIPKTPGLPLLFLGCLFSRILWVCLIQDVFAPSRGGCGDGHPHGEGDARFPDCGAGADRQADENPIFHAASKTEVEQSNLFSLYHARISFDSDQAFLPLLRHGERHRLLVQYIFLR